MYKRTWMWAIIFIIVGLIASSSYLVLQDKKQPEEGWKPQFDELPKKAEQSIDKGVKWLLKFQNKDGSWGCVEPPTPPSSGITGLAVLALMGKGDTINRGENGEKIKKAVDWLLKISKDSRSGKIIGPYISYFGEIFDHATALLALATVYGTYGDREKEEEIRDAIKKGVKYLEQTQNRDGGWSRTPGSSHPADTAFVWLALRAAHHTGISVSIDDTKIENYAKSVAGAGGEMGGMDAYNSGGYLMMMFGYGHNERRDVQTKCDHIAKTFLVGGQAPQALSEYDFIGAFLISKTFIHEKAEKFWKKWFPKARDYMVRAQNKDGSWTIVACTACKALATALALDMLQVPYRLLPYLQL
jgi:hypothetical protein